MLFEDFTFSERFFMTRDDRLKKRLFSISSTTIISDFIRIYVLLSFYQ